MLQSDSALNGFDDTAKLSQQAIARQLEDTAAVLLNPRLDYVPAVLPKSLERACFVQFHESTVPDHIGGQDGGETAL
jgi:hypothetical protein